MLEVGSPSLPPFFPSVLEETGGSEGEGSLFFASLFFPPVAVGSGEEAVDDTSGGLLLVETGRESVGGILLFFPSLLLPPFGGSTGEMEGTAGDETGELRTLEETLVEGTVEEVGSTGGMASEFPPPSVTVI